ncbi:MAG: phage major capsid protein [Rubrivivax sp.]|nr:phage major capsid protein [Rubrivivax sp.]
MKQHLTHTRVCLLILTAALLSAVWLSAGLDPSVPLMMASAGAVDWATVMKGLDKIEDKLHQLPELADRVLTLEQKASAGPVVPMHTKPADQDGPVLQLRSAADFKAYYRKGEEARIGVDELLRGIAGMKTTERATKALSVGTDTAGGHAVPRATFGDIMAALVPNSALLQAGASVDPVGDAKSITTAIVNAIPTAAWRQEAGAIAESDPTFRSVVATPQSLSFRFKVSRELLADAPNMLPALELVIAQALAKELDRTGLRGSGTLPEPRGLLNTAGVYTIGSGPNGSAGPGYDTILSVFDDILQANAPMPTAAVMAPRSWVRLMSATDTAGQPKQMPKALEALQMVHSSQVPISLTVGTSNDCSELYVGDFTKMSLMIRETLSLQKLDELYAETGQIGFIGHLRADVCVWYPSAFAVVTGLR